jgi:hypothetical protein
MGYRYLIVMAALAALAGCGASTTWKDAKGETAAPEEVRACRSQAGFQATDPRGRAGLSLTTPGAMDDMMLGDTRFAEEQRQRQQAFGQCMRKLGYRAQ